MYIELEVLQTSMYTIVVMYQNISKSIPYPNVYQNISKFYSLPNAQSSGLSNKKWPFAHSQPSV